MKRCSYSLNWKTCQEFFRKALRRNFYTGILNKKVSCYSWWSVICRQYVRISIYVAICHIMIWFILICASVSVNGDQTMLCVVLLCPLRHKIVALPTCALAQCFVLATIGLVAHYAKCIRITASDIHFKHTTFKLFRTGLVKQCTDDKYKKPGKYLWYWKR